jgi:hypothetical protein
MAAAGALLVELGHLGWEATHGGIRVHHLLQRADLPGLHNAWGLLVLPLLAWWAVRRAQRRGGLAARPVQLGLAVALALGLALSTAFALGAQSATEAIFFTAIGLSLLLPAYRAECLLGWVLGMLWAFGALLPLAIGSVLAGLSALLHCLVWPGLKRAWRTVSPAGAAR